MKNFLLALAAAALTGAPAAAPAAPASKEPADPAPRVVAIAKGIPRQAAPEEVERLTAELGAPLGVRWDRCKAGSGECTAADEASATLQMPLWGVRGEKADVTLAVNYCRTGEGWRVGRVRVVSHPRPSAGPGAKEQQLYDGVDAKFFRATCWK